MRRIHKACFNNGNRRYNWWSVASGVNKSDKSNKKQQKMQTIINVLGQNKRKDYCFRRLGMAFVVVKTRMLRPSIVQIL